VSRAADDQRGRAPHLGTRLDDRTIEAAMGLVLRIGVGVAAVLVAVGGVAYLAEDADAPTRYHRFGAAQTFTTPGAVLHAALAFDPAGVIGLGLIVLVLTPVARMVFALCAFAIQRDRLYVAFSAIVLVVLAIGLTGHAL